jgi:hypothetical protein
MKLGLYFGVGLVYDKNRGQIHAFNAREYKKIKPCGVLNCAPSP